MRSGVRLRRWSTIYLRQSLLRRIANDAADNRLGRSRAGSAAPSSSTLRQGDRMPNKNSRVTIHMAASLDGFIARKDGRVEWLETSDEFAGGETLDPGFVAAFLKSID